MSQAYEEFRSDLLVRLNQSLLPDQLQNVLRAVDLASASYDFNRKELAITASGGFPEAARIYLAAKSVENLSPRTLRHYRYKLINFFACIGKPYAEITPNDIRLYLHQYKQKNGNSDATVDSTRTIINSFFAWLVANDYLPANPVAKVQRVRFQKKKRVALSPYTLEVLRWNCRNIREKALVDFLYSTGCRVGELVAVDQADINWNDRSVRIRHGKGDKERTVFFNAESELTLRKYLESRDDDCSALFVSSRRPHHAVSTEAIQATIRKIRVRVDGIGKVTPHVLRHTFATTGIRSGVPLEQLQLLMGHTKPETTLIYANVDTTDLQRIHRKVYL